LAKGDNKPARPFQVGDRVKIRFSNWPGRVVEERGALGPGGLLVYRVRIPRRPKAVYVEFTEDQLIAIPAMPEGAPASSESRRAAESRKRNDTGRRDF
jgi:hypothetical protein